MTRARFLQSLLFRSFLSSLAIPGLLLTAGCNGDDEEQIFISSSGTVATDFQTIADYLGDPVVQLLLQNMPRAQGSNPPDVSGEYTANGELTTTSIPGTAIGDDFGPFFFCLGSPSGGAAVVARVLDASVEDAGARSFIEGSGDRFTVFTAFRSVQLPEVNTGDFCEIHQVAILTGTREADGSISDLSIGQGVVGLVGDCEPLIVTDVQVAETIAERTGDGCAAAAGGSEDLVDLVVENALTNPVLVFVDYADIIGPQPFVVFPGEISQSAFVPPGFFLSFESIQPSQPNPEGNEVLMGEIVAGSFDEDVTPPGDAVSFLITNQVGDDVYFAPLPVNQTADDIFAIVNSDPGVANVDLLVGPGAGCRCPLPPSPEPYDIGYYPYDLPGFITPEETNVRFFRFADDQEIAFFEGPFPLEPESGAVVLDVTAAAALAGGLE